MLFLKQCFPLVGTLGHEWVPERTPEGAKRERSTRSAAESCADGLSWHNRTGEWETNGMSRPKRNEVEWRSQPYSESPEILRDFDWLVTAWIHNPKPRNVQLCCINTLYDMP